MTIPFFDLQRQHARFGQQLTEGMSRVLNSQQFILGPEVEAFERELADLVGVARVVGVASGTDAILLALKALGYEPGDEVVVPTFTFFATAGAVWNAGLKPVFCDVDPATFNVSVDTLEPALTSRTRAVIPVHLFGQMAPMTEIVEWARRHGLDVIEDAAQAMGASQVGATGSVSAAATGVMGALSFFPTKNLGAFGDAGAVAATDPALGERVAAARTHGGQRMYHHEFVGTNSRLDALQAAILRAKLPLLSEWVQARQRNAAQYGEALAEVDGIELPSVLEGNVHAFNQFTIQVSRRDELRTYLTALGIGTAIYYPVPMHQQTCFESLGYRRGQFPVAERLSQEVLSLPIFPELQEEEIEAVSSAVREFMQATRGALV